MQATAKHERRQRPLSRRYGPITRFGELWLLTPPGVFVPRSDAGMLLEAAAGHVRGRVLDVCTGSGVLALSVQPKAGEVTAIDSRERPRSDGRASERRTQPAARRGAPRRSLHAGRRSAVRHHHQQPALPAGRRWPRPAPGDHTRLERRVRRTRRDRPHLPTGARPPRPRRRGAARAVLADASGTDPRPVRALGATGVGGRLVHGAVGSAGTSAAGSPAEHRRCLRRPQQ